MPNNSPYIRGTEGMPSYGGHSPLRGGMRAKGKKKGYNRGKKKSK